MQSQNILRTILFALFFCIGAVGLSVSVLCEDLLRYHRNREALAQTEDNLQRLESLNENYEALLKQLREDPNLLKRLAPSTLKNDEAEPNTVYPELRPEMLEAARVALMEETDQIVEPAIPMWLARSSRQPHRTALFIAGAFLIIIAFVCFTTSKQEQDAIKARKG